MPIDGDTLATARVKLVADARGMPGDVRTQTQRGLGAEAERAGSQFGKRMMQAVGAAVAVGAGVVGAKLLGGIKESIAAASDLNEVSSKVGVVFGKSAADVRKWSEHMATDFGQSKRSALEAASTFAIYGKAAKLTGSNLVNFSTHLTTLASDMASFSNSTPEEAIAAIGSALRGEFDPIERYGVLLNETTVKNEALAQGLIKTTTQALTPQQRVLAVQSLIFKQTKDAMGDFERTSQGLANQQRIASAQIENLKAKIGAGLLPVATRLVQVFNSQVIPAFNELWSKHGPAITRVLEDVGVKVANFIAALARGDFSGQFNKMKDTFDQLRAKAVPALQELRTQLVPAAKGFREDLVPALQQLKREGGQGLADTINVTAVAMGFLAQHTDLLAKALPLLVAAYGAYKIAQLGSNVAMAASPVIRLMEIRATRQQTAAIIANTAARAGETTATVANSGATAANTVAQNTGIVARTRAAVATKASAVAMNIANVATKVWTVSTYALGAAVRFAMGPIGLIITAIGFMVAAVIFLYKNNETARRVIDGAWKVIRVTIKAVGDWFTKTLWPSLQRAFQQLMEIHQRFRAVVFAVFSAVAAYIRFQVNAILFVFRTLRTFVTVTIPNAYRTMQNFIRSAMLGVANYIRDRVNSVLTIFGRLRTFITVTLPNGFRTGVTAIRNAWAKVQQAARDPVSFVVNRVINPLISGYNSIAGVFHAPKASTIKGFDQGGQIPGMPSDKDNRIAQVLAAGGRVAGNIKVATGEFIVNTRSTMANLPLIKAINNARGPLFRGQRMGVNTAMDGLEGGEGFEDGGIVGFFKKVGNGLKGVANFVTDPVGAIKKLYNGVINKVPGAGPFVSLIKGMAGKVFEGVKNFLGGLGGSGSFGPGPGFPPWPSSPSAQRGDSGVWRSIVALIRSTGPLSGSFGNAYRPGDPKWHGSGRAVDWMGYNQDELAQFLANRRPLELIHRTKLRDYAYTRGKNKGSFNSSLMQAHRNHIHIAMAEGGEIPTFDVGGVLRPGLNAVYNGTGRPERVAPVDQGMLRWHPADLEALGHIIAREMSAALGAGNYAAGRKVSIYARGG